MAASPLSENPPCKEDVLVRADLPDWQNNACLSPYHGDDYGYSKGYLSGAGHLVRKVIDTGTEQDVLVYPIVFLYRHHIELSLKALLRGISYTIDHTLTANEKKHLNDHKLDKLWQDIRPKISVMCEAAGWDCLPNSDLEGVDSYIRQISALDPNSYTFRYMRNKQGEISLPKEMTNLHLRHFALHMERLADYLDSLGYAVGGLETIKTEMEAEQRSQYEY
jgi:hypothetical protein